MKRIVSILIAISLLCFSGCSNDRPSNTNTSVNFYYCSDPMEFNANNSVIRAETRQTRSIDWATELSELVNLYFEGPVSSDLRSPFPTDITLNNYSLDNDVLQVILSIQISQLEGYDLTLACACLTKTLLEIVPAEAVEIRAEGGKMGDSISVSMSRETLLLIDNYTQSERED